MKTNTSSPHSPTSASTSAPAASASPFSPASEIPHGVAHQLLTSAARSLETQPSLANGHARSRVHGRNGHGNGSHTSHSHADAATRALATQTDALARSSFSDAAFVRSAPTSDLRAGIALCRHARLVLQAAAVRSFDAGGMELDPVHLRLLLDCAQMCETTADFMSRNSPYHLYLCEVCAALCEACAESCALAGSMEECAAICQECLVVCRALAG